ncbi:nitrite reductase small subunit NirD [Chitinophaga horti]|uniref:Nitrite reductase small subunit NirD n=1 Tax=Chitinophaga horti TaxID=2920382 RepID=A0ABY6J123_9BACT|nr:nitrite reductase small subunit NirD [Chitinophaga horti]UYQ93379.1 nitrite reductase small subunit NirD [Chitinophaga horti]
MSILNTEVITWFFACKVEDVPANGGVCVKYNDEQIALFNFARRGEWYASQNLCPHRMQMALSRGMTGTQQGEPKVACPFHKKTFSLEDGRCLSDEHECSITVYPVRVEDDRVYIGINNGKEEAVVMA